ncbi:hypothetical protein ACFFMP_05365 [Pseudoroseomonas cervicalis]
MPTSQAMMAMTTPSTSTCQTIERSLSSAQERRNPFFGGARSSLGSAAVSDMR